VRRGPLKRGDDLRELLKKRCKRQGEKGTLGPDAGIALPGERWVWRAFREGGVKALDLAGKNYYRPRGGSFGRAQLV